MSRELFPIPTMKEWERRKKVWEKHPDSKFGGVGGWGTYTEVAARCLGEELRGATDRILMECMLNTINSSSSRSPETKTEAILQFSNGHRP